MAFYVHYLDIQLLGCNTKETDKTAENERQIHY
jgi:hypothetical protein